MLSVWIGQPHLGGRMESEEAMLKSRRHDRRLAESNVKLFERILYERCFDRYESIVIVSFV